MAAFPARAQEAEAPRPAWLLKSEKCFTEGLKAGDAGDEKTSAAQFRRALVILAKKSDQNTLLSLKDDIESLFATLQDALSPSSDGGPGLDVTEEELEEAPPANALPLSGKNYTVPISVEEPLVQKYITLYTSGARRGQMQKALDRMSLYKPMILKRLKDAGLPRELLYLAMVESEFQPTVTSRAGAAGLWQFMVPTGRYYNLKVNYWVDDRRDPEKATDAAVKHLKDLYLWFNDWPLALAAYNRGLYGIQRDLEFSRSTGFSDLSARNALPNETEHYVPKFAACVLIGENPAAYGFQVNTLEPPAFDEVVLDKPIDLKVAAGCAGTTDKILHELNPALRLWCTPRNETPYPLRLPAGTKEKFLAQLATVKEWTPSPDVIRYRVQRGDFLGRIAAKFKTTVRAIQEDNRVRNPKHLRPGQVLLIRPGRNFRGE